MPRQHPARPVAAVVLRTALVSLVVVAAACAPAAPASPSAATPTPAGPSQDPGTTPAVPSTPADGPSPSPDVAEAIAFRRGFGLRADLAWVLAVAANPDAVMDYGVPLLPFERDAIEQRATGDEALVGAISAYLGKHPDVSGGIYIDQARGGLVTALVTSEPDLHEAAIRAVVGDGAVFAVRQVRWSEDELEALQGRISDATPLLAAIPARLVSTELDTIANVVRAHISSAQPDAAVRLATAVGAEPGQLEISSDGTGLLLQPTGRIRGRIVAPAGMDVTALSPQYEADVDIGPRDAVGIAVAPDGSFLIDDLPPTGYLVTILALADAGNTVVGSARVTVAPGGTVAIEIPVHAP